MNSQSRSGCCWATAILLSLLQWSSGPALAQATVNAPLVECPGIEAAAFKRPIGQEATPKEAAALLAATAKSSMAGLLNQQLGQSLQQVIDGRKNVTRLAFDQKHGSQVSFSTADGRIFLWYPGNAVVLAGRWQACERAFSVSTGGGLFSQPVRKFVRYGVICFQYGDNTYNPVTKKAGGGWECNSGGALEARLVEKRTGDSFGLSSRTAVPFAIERDKTTLDLLLARMKKPATTKPDGKKKS